jgi:enolase
MKTMHKIKSIHFCKILNSHADFTNEFIITFDDGSEGIGSAPKGETISIYETGKNTVDPKSIIENIKKDGYFRVPLNQLAFDSYLEEKMNAFGRNNTFALSLSFYNAAGKSSNVQQNHTRKSRKKGNFPRLCLNILNGGKHAYTNPVLSDFPEYLLVSKKNDIRKIIREHNQIQDAVKSELLKKKKTVINNNPVHRFDATDNHACIEFLIGILKDLRLEKEYDLMIDASAGDLFQNHVYKLSLTDKSRKSSSALCSYWLDLIKKYNIRYLEDPFHEKDFDAWSELTKSQAKCFILGDNFYSSSARRIEEGADKKYTHGVIIKPDQAGTVSATMQAIESARNNKQIVITSHRSISTESVFLSSLTVMYGIEFIKIGPLLTDYSSIIRLNELMRLTGEGYE